jgi:hypothetical protein
MNRSPHLFLPFPILFHRRPLCLFLQSLSSTASLLPILVTPLLPSSPISSIRPPTAVFTIVRTEGVRGLYKGIWPNLLKCAPAMGTSFAVYEAVKDFLDHRTEEKRLV